MNRVERNEQIILMLQLAAIEALRDEATDEDVRFLAVRLSEMNPVYTSAEDLKFVIQMEARELPARLAARKAKLAAARQASLRVVRTSDKPSR